MNTYIPKTLEIVQKGLPSSMSYMVGFDGGDDRMCFWGRQEDGSYGYGPSGDSFFHEDAVSLKAALELAETQWASGKNAFELINKELTEKEDMLKISLDSLRRIRELLNVALNNKGNRHG